VCKRAGLALVREAGHDLAQIGGDRLMRLLAYLILPFILLVAACGGEASKPLREGESVIEVRDAFIVKPPEGRDMTGGGLTVLVQGAPLTLIGARTVAARKVEMHTMSMANDMMQMRQVESFPVSEDAPLVLERGGNHLMLFGVGPIELDSEVDIVLTFTDEAGGEIEVVTKALIVPPGG
jgi:copper(I)-binding protein